VGIFWYKLKLKNMKNKIFAQKMVFFGWIGIIAMLLLIPRCKSCRCLDSPMPVKLPKVEYHMTAEKLKYDVVEFLNEQDIKYNNNEPIRQLMAKAMKVDYSPSDDMYGVENGAYIPSDMEIKQTIDTLMSGVIIK
jgi:hypothetical protein